MVRSIPSAALLTMLLLAAVVPSSSGQAARDLSTLTLHAGDSNWMDEIADNGDDSGSILLDSTGQIGAEPVGLTFPLTPALDADLDLDGQPIAATIVLGTAYLQGLVPSTVPGPVTVTLTLAAGSTALATGSATGNLPVGTDGMEKTTFTFSMAPTATHIAQADNLALTVDISSMQPTGPFFFDTGGASFLALPLGTVAGAPSEGGLALATGQPEATAAAGDAALYNLTVGGDVGTNFTLGAEGLPAGYVAEFAPANGTLASATQEVTLSVTSPADASPGTYAFNATLATDGATVAAVPLTLVVQAATPGGNGPPSQPSAPPSDGSANDQQTGGFPNRPAEETPGFGMLASLLVVGALALVARRRLA